METRSHGCWKLKHPKSVHLALRICSIMIPDDRELQAASQSAFRSGMIPSVLDEMDPARFLGGTRTRVQPEVPVHGLVDHPAGAVGSDPGGQTNASRRPANTSWSMRSPENGQFSASGAPSGTADCLQGNLCWALMELGSDDPRLETAFDWMARSVTGEGIAPMEERHASALLCGQVRSEFCLRLQQQAALRMGSGQGDAGAGEIAQEAANTRHKTRHRQGVDFLFSVDPAEATYPSGWSSKPSQNWWKFGFPVFYVTDLLQIVEALVALGYGDDPRLLERTSIHPRETG